MSLYPYQQRVKELLHQGKPVVLQAPTGSGKTRAALAPFIEAFFDFPPERFPRQCLYAVPMRVLATQFEREYRGLAESYERKFRRRLDVRIQTGERPEDPELMGDLVFATLDQVLSSALGVPYSLSTGRTNLNVGAVWSSYLVFDEFHLFPPPAVQTTLQLLQVFGRYVPFILMTATFSSAMLGEIADRLKAEPVYMPPEEIAWVETRRGQLPRKERRLFVHEKPLNAGDILNMHNRRSVAVCNTVERAMALYDDLVNASGCRPVPVTSPALTPLYERLRRTSSADEHRRLLDRAVNLLRTEMADAPEGTNWVMLLHSRFERPHRQVKEALLSAECGPLRERWQIPRLLVVATQVVEVGLDCTSQVLHTELAPAASVIQRAGRCARYPGEQGEVHVYPVPYRDDGQPDYAPYLSKEEKSICERTGTALRQHSGQILDFAGEQELVDEAHQEADQALLQAMREDQGRIWERIRHALLLGEASARPELIRQVDSRTLIVYDAPAEPTEESPFRYEGFSLWHGTLRGAVDFLQKQAEALDLPWALRYPVAQREEEESRTPAVYRWLDVAVTDDISHSLLFAVHPALVSYDASMGFRLGIPSDGQYRSPLASPRAGRRENYTYTLEPYSQHVAAMTRLFERRLRHRLVWIANRLGMPETLEKAVRLVLALHDVGKLQEKWQEWAAKYQERVSGERPSFLVAHVLSETKEHREIARQIRPSRPPHAGEGAFASARILYEALDGSSHPKLYQAALTAIARHHSPTLQEAAPYRLHPQARDVLAEALKTAGESSWRDWAQKLIPEHEAPNLGKRLLPPSSGWDAWLLYFIIVRMLRLCDGLSQEE